MCVYTCRRGHTCVCMYDLYTSCTCVIFPCQEIAMVASILWRTVSPSGFDENSPASILGECLKYLVEIQHLLSLAFSSIYIKKTKRRDKMYNNTTFDPACSQDENGETLHSILLVLSQISNMCFMLKAFSVCSSFPLMIQAIIMIQASVLVSVSYIFSAR